jgi:hypothetical protein
MPISRTVPTEYSTPLAAFQIRFDESEVPPCAAPALPNGASGITDQMAVEIAMRQSGIGPKGKLPPGVQVAARFGSFSNDVLARRWPGEPMKLLYQDRPAWLVTFFGPGLAIPSHGRGHTRGLRERPGLKHETNTVIDACTGEHLQTFL